MHALIDVGILIFPKCIIQKNDINYSLNTPNISYKRN